MGTFCFSKNDQISKKTTLLCDIRLFLLSQSYAVIDQFAKARVLQVQKQTIYIVM